MALPRACELNDSPFVCTYNLLAAGAAAFEVGFFDFGVWRRFWTGREVFQEGSTESAEGVESRNSSGRWRERERC